MDILGQSALLVAISSFALGFSILARNVRNKLYLAFVPLTTLISAWALAFFLEKTWPGTGFYRLHLFFNIWLGPVALGFMHLMVRIRDAVSRILRASSVLLGLALSAALALGWDSNGWVLQLIYFMPGIIFIQILRLMWIDRGLRRDQPPAKMPTIGFPRRDLLYIGALFVLAFSSMDHIPQFGVVIPALGNLALMFYLFFVSRAISQQRLLNLGALFSRFLVLLFVGLTLAGIYALLVAWTANSPGLFFLNSFLASFMILMLLEPIHSLVGYLTQLLLTQKYLRLHSVLREAQRKLAGVVDLGGFFQTLLQTVEQTLEPRYVALFILRTDATKYRRVNHFGNERAPAAPAGDILREILADHPLMEYCETLRKKGDLPVALDQMIENEIDRSSSRTQKEKLSGLVQAIKALGASLVIPIFDAETGKALGFLAIYVPTPPEAWGNNWGLLQVLYPFFEQAGQTLRNMEIFAKQREQERLAALGEMAAGLAHEIRNPLGAIKGAAQYLDPTGDKPEGKFLKIIIEEVDRLNRVVTDFLDYSKPGPMELRRTDIAKLVEQTVETLRASMVPGITLELQKPRAPAYAAASPEKLQQVLINLVQNSIKALEGLPDGTIRVSVEVEGGQGPGAEVVIAVEDTGHGIKREHLDKLFIPFFTTAPSGTGLGLSISQKLVEAHRGRIDVATEEGRFTRFSVVLPYFAHEGA